MTPASFQRIGIIANLAKDGVPALLNTLVPALLSDGFEVSVEEQLGGFLDHPEKVQLGIPSDADLVIALGGDGTILRVARERHEEETPILGFRAGRLGFLAETLDTESIARIKKGGYEIQDRMRIDVKVMRGEDVVESFHGLNDCVVHGAGFSRMVTLRTEVDGVLLRDYRADGLILATPTGSTAYSLSAGGPLLTPTIRAMCLTPLCPHSLTVRPMVLRMDQEVIVRLAAPADDVRVTVDGQDGCSMEVDQHVVVERSDKVTRLLVSNDWDFFSLLREKL